MGVQLLSVEYSTGYAAGYGSRPGAGYGSRYRISITAQYCYSTGVRCWDPVLNCCAGLGSLHSNIAVAAGTALGLKYWVPLVGTASKRPMLLQPIPSMCVHAVHACVCACRCRIPYGSRCPIAYGSWPSGLRPSCLPPCCRWLIVSPQHLRHQATSSPSSAA